LFKLGDYEGVLQYEINGDAFTRTLAQLMLGRREEALASIESEKSLPHLLTFFATATKHLIRNELDQSRSSMDKVSSITDPEGRYYMGRHFAFIGDATKALSLLASSVDGGFFCVPMLAQDPWLDSVRGTSEFAGLLRRAETRHRQAVINFLTAEGDRILGIPHPV
jgi:hypothetical protein